MKVICFHNVDEDNAYLSNWYLSNFTLEGITFTSLEQYMMYKKAKCFNDNVIASKILATNDPATIKQLGREVANYNNHVWNGVRQIIVYNGLYAKFSQNEELKNKLKETGNALLCECAVNDKIWGIGLSMKDPNRLDPKKWQGTNLLGYALMLVREQL